MFYKPSLFFRKSIRLKGYDYSQEGMYFITICCNGRDRFSSMLFGEIENEGMNLNDSGKMIEKWYFELENKFPDIRCHQMVVMPNHFHCIIENKGSISVVDNPIIVGADLCVCPPDQPQSNNIRPSNIFFKSHTNDIEIECSEHEIECSEHEIECSEHEIEYSEHEIEYGEHIGSPLHRIVQWFKTMTTNEYIRGVKSYGWYRFDGKLWQRNYYEHIIRNERAYSQIVNYILNNPANWMKDRFRMTL